jgi:hypothetical protein
VENQEEATLAEVSSPIGARTCVSDSHSPELDEEDSEIIPRALAGDSAAETFAGAVFESEHGCSWDWPLSRQQKKERILMINQIQLLDELEELRQRVDDLTKASNQ